MVKSDALHLFAREVLDQVKVLDQISSQLSEVSFEPYGFASTLPGRLLSVQNRLRWAASQYANMLTKE